MSIIPFRSDEPGRLAALERLAVLDTAPEAPFENVVSLVRSVLGVPMASVTLVDADRQWFKARRGLDNAEGPRVTSFCGQTILHDRPYVIGDAAHDDRFRDNPLVLGDPNIRAYAGIPLKTAEGYNVGTLCAIDTRPREFSDVELLQLANLARIVTTELELRGRAEHDHLTGALGRRRFFEEAVQEIAQFQRYDRPSCLVMIDADHFKAVNDRYGHGAGDIVLRAIADRLRGAKRPTDILGRLGGEEFAMLLPETGYDDGLAAAERLRAALADKPIEIASGSAIGVTASFGVAALDHAAVSPEDWLAAADGPLYLAKRGGRNRCVGNEATRRAA